MHYSVALREELQERKQGKICDNRYLDILQDHPIVSSFASLLSGTKYEGENRVKFKKQKGSE